VVESKSSQNLDMFSVAHELGLFIVTLCAVRGGQMLGHRNFYPKVPADSDSDEVLSSFLTQYYQDKPVPELILLNHNIKEKTWIESALTQIANRTIKISSSPRGSRKKMLDLNTTNMKNALEVYVAKKANWQHKWQTWVSQVGLKKSPNRVECFDISHVERPRRGS
jgi:excinuclease ABC subunit C